MTVLVVPMLEKLRKIGRFRETHGGHSLSERATSEMRGKSDHSVQPSSKEKAPILTHLLYTMTRKSTLAR